MSQLFNVVKCYQCSMHQVDINKRSTNKWSCKLCGEKQSLKQVFFQGDSRDCRERVKALNELKNRNEQKSDQEKLENHFIQNNQQTGRFQESTINSSGSCEHSDTVEEPRVKESKWAKYLTNWDDENNYLY